MFSLCKIDIFQLKSLKHICYPEFVFMHYLQYLQFNKTSNLYQNYFSLFKLCTTTNLAFGVWAKNRPSENSGFHFLISYFFLEVLCPLCVFTFDCRSLLRQAIWNTFSPREQQSHIAYHWNKTLLKSLKAAFRIKLKPDREICLHFEMQNAKPLETTIIGEWTLEVFWNSKKELTKS